MLEKWVLSANELSELPHSAKDSSRKATQKRIERKNTYPDKE